MIIISPEINPAATLASIPDNTPVFTNTYFMNGTKQEDAYTAAELRTYMKHPQFNPYERTRHTVAQAVELVQQLF